MGADMEVRGGESKEEPLARGTQKFVYDQAGRVCWENSSKTGKLWKESAFVAATGILYLIIRLTFHWADPGI
ncbi:hypothetical protein T03_16114 [Trichinella britovi]|uniref:Uncharacterized protein n=1 Tax=Trichinella britovi TaxID=45882 RepID=A0A0V1D9E5_TRIBR|nr:hypothetical protein T03_16114 [Trichinella britovi]